LQSLFIIAGIIAAYYRFVKEKRHKKRLQPSISGVAAQRGGMTYLQVGVSVENVGRLPVKIDQAATGLRVSFRKTGDERWTRCATKDVFGQKVEVLSDETILDQVWFEMPDGGEVAFKLELSVIENEDSGWLAVEVVNLLREGNNESPESEKS